MSERTSTPAQPRGAPSRESPIENGLPGNGSYWLDRPRNVSKLYYAVWCAGALLVLLDFVLHRHDEIGFAETAGFYAAYGFVACVLLVLTAKALRRLLKRSEDYYEH